MNKFMFFLVLWALNLPSWAGIEGRWQEQDSQQVLQLEMHGRFSYGQQLHGHYRLHGQWLELEDQYGQVYRYRLKETSPDALVLEDDNGQSYRFVRLSQPSLKYSGSQWRREDTQVYVDLFQFLLDRPLTTQEIETLHQEGVQTFRETPQALEADKKNAQEALRQIQALQGQVDQLAQLKETILAALLNAMKQSPELAKKPSFALLQREILSYDPETGLSLSRSDVAAYLNYLQWLAQLQGQSWNWSSWQKKQIEQQLAQQFGQLPLEQKQALAFAAPLWQVIEQNRSQIEQAWRQQALASNPASGYGTGTYGGGGYGQSNASQIQEALRQQQMKMQMNQQMFDMMNNMMLENHATMLNIIDNIGSGNTDYYVDYNNY